jgi:hypothetical protein
MFFFLLILIFILKWVILFLFLFYYFHDAAIIFAYIQKNKENEIKRIISGIFSWGREPVKRKHAIIMHVSSGQCGMHIIFYAYQSGNSVQ